MSNQRYGFLNTWRGEGVLFAVLCAKAAVLGSAAKIAKARDKLSKNVPRCFITIWINIA
jgi:hypothetical protein